MRISGLLYRDSDFLGQGKGPGTSILEVLTLGVLDVFFETLDQLKLRKWGKDQLEERWFREGTRQQTQLGAA